MNKEIIRYQRELKKHLQCGMHIRKKLLSQFRDSLSSFLEENPEPNYEQLITAFGPPEEMANILMEAVPTSEQLRYRRNNKLVKILYGFVAVLFIMFALYVFYMKEFTIVTVESDVHPVYSTATSEENTQ